MEMKLVASATNFADLSAALRLPIGGRQEQGPWAHILPECYYDYYYISPGLADKIEGPFCENIEI